MTVFLRAVLAAAILIVPVVAQLVSPGLDERTAGHLVFAASQLAGWLLVGTIVRATAAGPTRSARFGRIALLVGCALQALFAVAYGLTATDGEPLEASFVLFLLGFLAVTVGGSVWGVALLRADRGRTAGVGLVAVALLGFLAIAIGADPFHDIFLVGSYAAWAVVGRGLDARRQVDPTTGARFADPAPPPARRD